MKKKLIYLLKYWGFAILAVVTVAFGVAYWVLETYGQEPPAPVQKTESQTIAAPKPKIKEVETPLPAKHLLTVPYTVQAPFAKWNIHEESCEEAAILMYAEYLNKNQADIAPQDADKKLTDLVAWQEKNWGPEKDLTITELGKLSAQYYNLKPKVETATEESIKRNIFSGKPVLVPVMTHSLKNPHYSSRDSYHILVIKGFDTKGVITNDAGIKSGKDWHYSWDILWSAIDAQESKMKQGRTLLTLEK